MDKALAGGTAREMILVSPNVEQADMERAEGIHTMDDFAKAPFMTKVVVGSSAAWSPNPKKPPLFLDLPTKNGKVQPEIMAEWAANEPLSMMPQYSLNLKRLSAIAFDVGLDDFLLPYQQAFL